MRAADSEGVRTPLPFQLPEQPITYALLLGQGVTPAMIRTQLQAGRLIRLRRGVFLNAAAVPSDARLHHIVLGHAEQVANPTAVLSHGSAAAAWKLPHPGFSDWWSGPVEVTLPRAGHVSRTRSTRHHRADLPASMVCNDPEGYPITTAARTAIDLAKGHDLPQALVILDAAARIVLEGFVAEVRRRDYTNPRLVAATRSRFEQAAATARGADSLRAYLQLVEPCRESAAESLSAGYFHLAGLPAPKFQEPVRTPIGVFFPDCLWGRVVGECDGAVKYERPGAWVDESTREQALRDLGYNVVRWQAKEIMLTPQTVVARVRNELGL